MACSFCRLPQHSVAPAKAGVHPGRPRAPRSMARVDGPLLSQGGIAIAETWRDDDHGPTPDIKKNEAFCTHHCNPHPRSPTGSMCTLAVLSAKYAMCPAVNPGIALRYFGTTDVSEYLHSYNT